jgi:hypothetical protein
MATEYAEYVNNDGREDNQAYNNIHPVMDLQVQKIFERKCPSNTP